jgi:glycosyltransferase involved in cell wall biosynthesis
VIVQGEHPGLLYVLPTFLGRSAEIRSSWLAAADLGSAVGARLGRVDLLSPLGLLGPREVRSHSVKASTESSASRNIVQALPWPARNAVGEVRRLSRAQRMRNAGRHMNGHRYGLVMQLHSRHQDVGLRIARRLGVSFVLRIEALEIREEAEWGIRRPVWGGLAERLGELRIIRQADLVAVASDDLDAQLAEAEIDDDRRVVVPNGVDLRVFSPGERDMDLLRAHHLDNRFVIGWVGGFRPFHGLDAIPVIARRLRTEVPGAVLCLVGTGQERGRIASLTTGLEDVLRFVEPVAHAEVARWIRSFDACLLLAGSNNFHYSPLKLYEYLACGRPVVAAAVGQVKRVIADGRNGLLVPARDPAAVVDAVARLAGDQALRRRLAEEARRTAERSGSWEARADTLLAALESRGLLAMRRTPMSDGKTFRLVKSG